MPAARMMNGAIASAVPGLRIARCIASWNSRISGSSSGFSSCVGSTDEKVSSSGMKSRPRCAARLEASAPTASVSRCSTS